MHTQEWLLKRNCSLSPRQMAVAYAILFCASFAVALAFALRGAWQIIVFSVLEMACVALAFLHYARHATDCEHVALRDGCLLIELVDGNQFRQFRLDPYWTRVASPNQQDRLVVLEARGVRVRVGRFVTEAKRLQFARELRKELQSRSGMPAAMPACA